MTMTPAEWHDYLRSFLWTHAACGKQHEGAREPEPGRVVGYCDECRETVLLHIWGSSGWIDAQAASIVLETD